MLICVENSNIAAMNHIDAEWIKDRLTGKRGEMAALARAMGIDSDKMSKVMRGERRVQPEEIPGALEFFNETLIGEHDEKKKRAIAKLSKMAPEKLDDAVRYLDYLEALPDNDQENPDN